MPERIPFNEEALGAIESLKLQKKTIADFPKLVDFCQEIEFIDSKKLTSRQSLFLLDELADRLDNPLIPEPQLLQTMLSVWVQQHATPEEIQALKSSPRSETIKAAHELRAGYIRQPSILKHLYQQLAPQTPEAIAANKKRIRIETLKAAATQNPLHPTYNYRTNKGIENETSLSPFYRVNSKKHAPFSFLPKIGFPLGNDPGIEFSPNPYKDANSIIHVYNRLTQLNLNDPYHYQASSIHNNIELSFSRKPVATITRLCQAMGHTFRRYWTPESKPAFFHHLCIVSGIRSSFNGKFRVESKDAMAYIPDTLVIDLLIKGALQDSIGALTNPSKNPEDHIFKQLTDTYVQTTTAFHRYLKATGLSSFKNEAASTNSAERVLDAIHTIYPTPYSHYDVDPANVKIKGQAATVDFLGHQTRFNNIVHAAQTLGQYALDRTQQIYQQIELPFKYRLRQILLYTQNDIATFFTEFDQLLSDFGNKQPFERSDDDLLRAAEEFWAYFDLHLQIPDFPFDVPEQPLPIQTKNTHQYIKSHADYFRDTAEYSPDDFRFDPDNRSFTYEPTRLQEEVDPIPLFPNYTQDDDPDWELAQLTAQELADILTFQEHIRQSFSDEEDEED